jgi:hypothetical protein
MMKKIQENIKKLLTFFCVIFYTLNNLSSILSFEEADHKINIKKEANNEKTGKTRRERQA